MIVVTGAAGFIGSCLVSKLNKDGITVEKEYESNNIFISGYKPQIEQVILNILMFCADKMPDGGKIRISVFKSNPKKAVITITDSSGGISETELSGLFDSYLSEEKQSSTQSYFNMSQHIIEEHKGKIQVFTETGKGNTFKIFFQTINND